MVARLITRRSLSSLSSPKQTIMLAVMFCILASFIVIGHSVAVAIAGAYGLIWLVIATTLSMFLSIELAFALMTVFLFLQNAFVGVVIPLIEDEANFQILLGGGTVNIVITALLCILGWMRWKPNDLRINKPFLIWLGAFMVAIAAYTVLGTIQSSASSAIIYGRIYVSGVLMLVIGAAMGLRLNFDFVFNVIRLMAIILVGWGLVEFFFTYDLYSFFNIKDYVNLKDANISIADSYSNVKELIQQFTRPYLNLSGQFGIEFSLLRPKGPNIHPISYGYALTFCCLMCFINRRYVLSGACLVMAGLVGAKGPLIMIVGSILLYMQYQKTMNRRWLLLSLMSIMIVYAVVGVAYGLASEDYHILGLMGALKGFVSNPLGHGIGVGGSLSSIAVQGTNFSQFQSLGAADFALESAIGVMLYQFGIAAAVFLMFYWHLWKNIWKATEFFASEPRLIIIPMALGLLLVNAIFQEEAFSPLGWGPWLMISGMLLVTHWRQASYSAEYREHHLVDDNKHIRQAI